MANDEGHRLCQEEKTRIFFSIQPFCLYKRSLLGAEQKVRLFLETQ